MTKIYLAAMSRADVPATVLAGLPNFYFYVDEFQNFANESFADILSEARKYKLNLLIAHQYVEQMEEEVRDAVFGNVGTTVAFRVGPFDAETLEVVFTPQFTATDLVNLGFAQIYLTLMIDGVGSPPFSATTLPPFDKPPHSFVPQVLASSRLQFAKPRGEVEEAIRAWSEADTPTPAQPKSAAASAPRTMPRAQTEQAVARAPAPVPVRVPAPHPERVVRPAPPREPVYEKAAQEFGHGAPSSTPKPVPVPTTPPARPPEREVRKPAPPAHIEPRPPLEGATSLRDALRAVTAQHQAPTPTPALAPTPTRAPSARILEHIPEHAAPNRVRDLQTTIGHIINTSGPNAARSPQTPHTEPHPQTPPHQQTHASHQPPPEPFVGQKAHEPAGLPEAELRTMLAVDGFDQAS